MQPSSYRPHIGVPRYVLAFAAALASLGSFAALLAGFDDASPRLWLLPTPTVQEMIAQCSTFARRAERDACSRQVVAALIEHQRRELMLAQR